MRNMDKSNVLTSIEPINRTLKEEAETVILKNVGTKYTQFRNSGKIFFLAP
jgi:hypothetical protein